jgi:tight adherence protein C
MMRSVESLPVAIAAVAFITYIDSSRAFETLIEHEYPWQRRESIKARLAQLGRNSERDFEYFRIAQMTIAVCTNLIVVILSFLISLSLISTSALILISTISVIYLSEANLTRRARKRKTEIESEFPAIIEILTLAIGAGESPASALRRISMRADGHFADSIKNLVNDVEKGISLISALDSMGRVIESESVRRFTDSMVISISRGSSIIETLEHAVEESRNHSRVTLINAASKSEVSMLIPVVFLILPISILFALYPSLANLNLFAN